MKALNSEITTIIEMIKDPMAVPMAHFTLSETKRDDFDCFSLIKTLLYRLGTNYVASTPHGLNVALFTRAVDLITQIADIDIHNVKIAKTVIVAGGGEETLTAVSTLLAQCSKMGSNLNQLARHFNSGGADTEQIRAKILDELADLTAFRLHAEKVLGELYGNAQAYKL